MSDSVWLVINGIGPHAVSTDWRRLDAAVDRQLETHRTVSKPLLLPVQWGHLSDVPGTGFLATVADLMGDVVRYASDAAMREAVQGELIDALQLHPRARIASHSLGGIITADVLKRLRREHPHIRPQGWLSMGVPFAMPIYRDRRKGLREALRGMPWRDFGAPWDPVYALSRGEKGLEGLGWPCRTKMLDLGNDPLAAHDAYWDHARVARRLLNMSGGAR